MTRHPHARGLGMASSRSRERLVQQLREEGIRDARVLAAIAKVPRHRFIDEALASRAYDNTALPIGFGQTISQPYVVARMTEQLLAEPGVRTVLEVGTGCGYQTAILAELVDQVYSIERLQPLYQQARTRLRELGYTRVWLLHGDGYKGWPEHAPYDGILVAAASHSVPEALLRQLKPGGRMIIPVGPPGCQVLQRIVRTETGYETAALDAVSFVPLVSGSLP
ncbi:MAG TPA: protein-L-isoaspartate(D-aspartate) O-methyltransferase [Nevskiales bacterium]|nr:protein-L-isoaspartate(D-aspartate) O-methyltransferase [Nevskiales bacterium]